MMKMVLTLVLVMSFILVGQDENDKYKKVGLNIVFGGGFNTMKSWENYPDAVDNLDDIPGAGLIGLRMEYDFGQFINFPQTYIYAGSDYPITQIGKISIYDEVAVDHPILGEYEYSHTTFLSEFGIVKKVFFDEFGLVFGGSYIYESLSLDKTSEYQSFSESYSLYSHGFKGILGMNYMLGNAWFFEVQLSYTGAGNLRNEDGEVVFSIDDSQKIFENFPFDDVKENEYLVPGGLSVKIGLGLTL